MAHFVRQHWDPAPSSGIPRRDRQGCDYDAYVPDRLAGRTVILDGELAADIADAETAIVRLNESASSLAFSETLARLLLRAESVASSRIEGLDVGGRRLLRAEAARLDGHPSNDVTAKAVLANIRAMDWAIEFAASAARLDVSHILEIHRILLAGSRLDAHAGRIRTVQNWIGGSAFNPCKAAFVPPPPEQVEGLLEDLCAFSNEDRLPAVVQAALVHAQFETIHPFVDGNGRTGRALIHVVLRKRGVAPRVLPPISLILATWSDAYVDGLVAIRYSGAPDSADAVEGTNHWLRLFAAACRRAVDDAIQHERRVRDLRALWRARAGRVRAGSALDRLLDVLPGSPVLTARVASGMIGRSFQATNEALKRLEELGIAHSSAVGRTRNRTYEARDVIEAFTLLERQLAREAGDTLVAPPNRPVPARPHLLPGSAS